MPESFMPRWFPAVAPISENEICIMGGMGLVDGDFSCLGDVQVFDIQSRQAMKAVGNFAGLTQFIAMGNNATTMADNSIVALVSSEV